MLRELSIKNFAIIEDLTVGFVEGLTVLTGETGAGKSIIIDAVQLLAGGRGSQEFIRHGAKKAELEGLFAISSENHSAYQKCAEAGIEIEEGMVILRRDLNDNGKSVCRVNGKLVPLSLLREIGATLIDVHGQHESQELMDDKRHISLLDQFAGEDIDPLKERYSKEYSAYRELKKELAAISLGEQQVAQKIDLFSFQIKEIDACQFRAGEEEELAEERRRLMNFNKIYERSNTAHEAILGESRGLDWIGQAMTDLEEVATLDQDFREHSDNVSAAFYSLQEAAFQIKNILDDLEFNPERLNEVEQRLALIQSMKRKYGATLEDILTYREKIGEELESLINRDENMQKNEQQLNVLKEKLLQTAEKLTAVRKKAGRKLSDAIMQQLRALYMEKADFSVHFEPIAADQFDHNGLDRIVFYIATNVGEPPKPLTKIASGGELSRMMLALKTIFSSTNGITSIIFDEVDTGVSGRVAQAIAEKISAISMHSQVLCISHLPQVAAMADHHYYIKKQEEAHRTVTSLTEIFDNARIDEISRMMSGAEVTDLTFQHAKELVEIANGRKKAMTI
ncbi:DNA repair protein RecN [Viridibacillus sp. FSL R5-0477]|uniref:DNA repair protein RecN n=1 Tax=Viridibacillus arenosi FSL R5-213 TaxID=1227360 RepID=W4EXN8_9BACL|nr:MULTISPECIES: DNA repair protein RecN [Viridibacillus]ETT85353.1 DNA repair protein recN (recombination protein N) [Viridibacillus arenosi FSL R5-213]OMC80913.1 DNA repair protein RecN [Viridibacillus sp. FSL H8-0123]OMC86637.1 DNA repair protein RecN [Viridibacillus sp. FSL H7-0596]OMC89413.1 DNA repair protein RecN [Viridibacillus arenosi]